MDAQRALLDALMGRNRDGDNSVPDPHYSDPESCRYFLTGLCPHTLFQNTVRSLYIYEMCIF